MAGFLLKRLDRLAGLACESAYENAVYRERFMALRRQLPWLYATLCINVVSIYVVAADDLASVMAPVAAITAVVAFRFVHLLRTDPVRLSDARIRQELRNIFIVASVCFAANAIWMCVLFAHLDGTRRGEMAVLGGLAAIGASSGLSSFPRAARIPLATLALPCSIALVVQFSAGHLVVGLGLFVLTSIKFRMLSVTDGNFTRLMTSRMLLETEKKRAVDAERAAVAEKHRVTKLANSDPLTGVANRRGFQTSLELLAPQRRRDLALILLDLDGFKPINDTFGHPTGDAILMEVADRLRKLAGSLPVSRVGGDEFAIVCRAKSAEQAMATAKKAVVSLSRPFRSGGRVMRISACAGVSRRGGDDVSEAIRRADIALFHAKREGRGSVAFFTDEMQHQVQRQTAIEQALREPGLAGSIDLSFQPIFHLDSLELQSFEALARWDHPELGPIPPSEFIPISEQISVVREISEDLLRRASAASRFWPSSVRLSFNLSPVQLCSGDEANRVLDIIASQGMDPRRLQVEVTETALLADFDLARRNLSRLRAEGVRIALDDFGAGYSSITYLRQMRFDTVKLDGSLITTSSDGSGAALLKGVLGFCEALGHQCVAEHIETDSHLELLRSLGCKYGQGFHLSPPLTEMQARRIARSRLLKFPVGASAPQSRRRSARG